MSAELLRRAAKVLREAAEAASAGPWHAHPDGLVWPERIGDPVSGSTGVEDAEYIALMHPPVALALAEMLTDAADAVEAATDLAATFEVEAHEILTTTSHAVAVARAILREES